MTILKSACASLVSAVDARLDELLPENDEAAELSAAVRHAALAPGKRLRPILTLLIAAPDGEAGGPALDIGCACEMVHAASLILDDLPAMDDATIRRGRPCTHLAFSQSTAILAATALLNRAYEVVAEAEGVEAENKVQIISLLARAIGESGLIGGQFDDLASAANSDESALSRYMKKTGSLFEFSILSGAVLRGLDETACDHLRTVSRHLGVAFQIHDDLLDFTGTVGETQKDCGQDREKATFIAARSPRMVMEKIINGRDDALAALAAVETNAILPAVIAEQFDLAIRRSEK